jgi:ABC-type protease/lipase transport system fused ATPase/permease subunit
MSVENLSYTPPGMQRAVVRNLSVEITAGEVIAIVGPSGSGKSTLARLMLGILAPGAGSVRLDGAALAQWEPARLGACVGYLPQDVALFSGTIAENIARLGAGDSDEVVAAAQRAHAHEMIVRLPNGYDTQIGDSGLCLSGGQRQRVALARALYGEPRIVVLDEPNANLDADGEQALTRAIGGLRECGATVVLITQRTQILSIADRILVMRDGAIERVGLRQERGAVIGDESNVPVLHPA